MVAAKSAGWTLEAVIWHLNHELRSPLSSSEREHGRSIWLHGLTDESLLQAARLEYLEAGWLVYAVRKAGVYGLEFHDRSPQ